jgi:hypothetical protein
VGRERDSRKILRYIATTTIWVLYRLTSSQKLNWMIIYQVSRELWSRTTYLKVYRHLPNGEFPWYPSGSHTPIHGVTLDARKTGWLTWLISQGPKARLCIFFHMRTRMHYLTWDTSSWSWYKPYAYPHTSHHLHTSRQTELRLTMQVHMQHMVLDVHELEPWVRDCSFRTHTLHFYLGPLNLYLDSHRTIVNAHGSPQLPYHNTWCWNTDC